MLYFSQLVAAWRHLLVCRHKDNSDMQIKMALHIRREEDQGEHTAPYTAGTTIRSNVKDLQCARVVSEVVIER